MFLSPVDLTYKLLILKVCIFLSNLNQEIPSMDESEIRIKALEEENRFLKEKLNRLIHQDNHNAIWLQKIIDSMPNPVFMKNSNREFVLCNVAFADMFGLPADDLYGKKDEDFSPPDEVAIFKQKDEEVLANGIVNWNQETHTMAGKTKTILTSKTRIEDEKGKFYVLGCIADITDNKNQHTLLLKKKNEVEEQKAHIQILLKEIHHRVKNNLQIINSLLNLQIAKIDHPEVETVILNAKNRIYSMAKIHEILCESDSLSSINLKVYLKSLIKNIKQSIDPAKSILFNTKIPNLLASIEVAIPIGLIINEVITNSIKYGMSETGTFEIYIILKKNSRGIYTLAIGDNGEGVNQKEFKPSLGSELIEVFAEQLDADYSIPIKEKGVHYFFKFS